MVPQVRKFEAGKTTYADVVKELGPPTTVTAKSNGTRSCIYTYTMAKARAASFIPVVGIFPGGADTRITNTTFNFDASGLLTDYSTGNTSLGAGALVGDVLRFGGYAAQWRRRGSL